MARNVMYMLKNAKHTQMQSFIIRDTTGKTVVIDGGNTADGDYLLKKLKEVTGEAIPHVDAWFFTHPHSDHLNAFFHMLHTYRGQFSFDAIYCCFPSLQYIRLEENAVTLDTFWYMEPKYYPGKVVTVSVDDVYTFGEMEFKVLYTVDCSIKNNVNNNSSTVLKMTLGGKTVLFLGDLGEEGGDKLLAAKPDEIVCDYCQMAHHGQNGVKKSFYEAVKPRYCLWCAPEWLYNNDDGKGYNKNIFQTVIVRGWMDELGTVEKNYCIKDGDQEIEF